MYGIEHVISLWTFIRAIGVGFVIGIIYEVFRVFRQVLLRGKHAVFIQDIVFIITATAITFVYLLTSTYGIVRGYVLLGETIGFIIYFISLGKLIFYYGKKFEGRRIIYTNRITARFAEKKNEKRTAKHDGTEKHDTTRTKKTKSKKKSIKRGKKHKKVLAFHNTLSI